MTFALLKIIGALMPLRATEPEEAQGMDVIYHGEEAYPTGEGAILVMPADGNDAPAASTSLLGRFSSPRAACRSRLRRRNRARCPCSG